MVLDVVAEEYTQQSSVVLYLPSVPPPTIKLPNQEEQQGEWTPFTLLDYYTKESFKNFGKILFTMSKTLNEFDYDLFTNSVVNNVKILKSLGILLESLGSENDQLDRLNQPFPQLMKFWVQQVVVLLNVLSSCQRLGVEVWTVEIVEVRNKVKESMKGILLILKQIAKIRTLTIQSFRQT